MDERNAAVEALSRLLYERMEHLDPSLAAPEWSGLRERDREFYRLCIETIFAEDALCRAALDRSADNNGVDRQAVLSGAAVTK